MEHYARIDVPLERSSVCVVDASGRIVREAKVASEPEALADFFRQLGLPLTRVGLEAGPGGRAFVAVAHMGNRTSSELGSAPLLYL